MDSRKADQIWMKKPAGWAGELWRESLPLGNGLTGALLSGGAGVEHFFLNRYDRWEHGSDGEIPDVHDALARARALIKEGRYKEANAVTCAALAERGYRVELATPMAPLEIALRFDSQEPFRHYRRGLNLSTGEAWVEFDQGEDHIRRRAFVSRQDDAAALDVRSTGSMQVQIDLPEDARLHVRILTDGSRQEIEGHLRLENASFVTVLARFDGDIEEESYDRLFAKHLDAYRDAMGQAEIDLGGGGHDTGYLLDMAQEEEAPAELYEKLWRFGRYLFISGTAEGGCPFPLYGLWPGQANLPWCQNVANENVQMIYWHAPVNGCADLIRPLIHYYFGKMDVFRQAARRIFGCRGIFVSVYTTPQNSAPAPNVPVIVNYIGAAGWLCRHFYDYYRYTGDRELMEKEILPFMLESAAFYGDYITWDENGQAALSPSVSPENTPGSFMPRDFRENMGHINPVVRNSTMDFAIVKELFTSLVRLSDDFPLDEGLVDTWRSMLSRLPEYQVNGDGALKEWMSPDLSDNYAHRHLSHLYPLFPGEEIHSGHPLFSACERAVDLRRLGAASGWALAHQSAIYARLGRGDQALKCLNIMAKGCLLPNLFTLHNDWRDMGVTLRIDMFPVQLDALLGAVNAIQEMLLRADENEIRFLPACPAAFDRGSVACWRVPGGEVSFSWDEGNKTFRACIRALRGLDVSVILPGWTGEDTRRVTLKRGEETTIDI